MMNSTAAEVQFMTSLIKLAVRDVIANDSDILNSKRKVGEMAINHRLAVYLERHLPKFIHRFLSETASDNYFFDLEYDRNYGSTKKLVIDGVEASRRPDILVHSRTNDLIPVQHLLAVEAKKRFSEKGSSFDTKKIKALMQQYNYKFGLTILYRCRRTFVTAKLYYCIEDIVECTLIEVSDAEVVNLPHTSTTSPVPK